MIYCRQLWHIIFLNKDLSRDIALLLCSFYLLYTCLTNNSETIWWTACFKRLQSAKYVHVPVLSQSSCCHDFISIFLQMGTLKTIFITLGIISSFLIHTQGADKYTDGNRPYEFGFKIGEEQHRHEKKGKNRPYFWHQVQLTLVHSAHTRPFF